MHRQKVTVSELAKRIGMSTGFISGVRDGNDIKLSQAMAICNAMHMDIKWWLNGESELEPEEMDLITALRQHAPRFRSCLTQFVSGLL